MNSDILSYLEVALIDDLYEPPIALDTLAKALRVDLMHLSAIEFKRNTLTYAVTVNDVLPRPVYSGLPHLWQRLLSGDLGYTYKPRAYSNEGRIDYRDGQIFHLAEYDVAQELYGLPQHVSGLTSIWLNDDATLFRRQYYRNGSHAGYLLYMNEPGMTKETENDIRNKLKAKEGMAFKNLFVNAKGKDTKAPELKPTGQVEAKDSFKDVKNQTMNDVPALHRVPIELMSVRRESITSLDLNKVDWLFHKNELLPLIDSLTELHGFVGSEVLKLNDRCR